jgi:hypothetical protein
MVGDTAFTVTPYFHLRRKSCDVFADAAKSPRFGVIIPHTPYPDVYLFGADALDPPEMEAMAGFLAQLDPIAGYLVPVDLVQPIRSRRMIYSEVEGLCFTYRQIPQEFAVWRPELVHQLTLTDRDLVEALPDEAGFVYDNYRSSAALLAEGLAFGVIQKGRLVSLAASLALTPNYCDVGVYTLPRFRHLRYATDCIEAIFAHVLARDIRPLWRIGVRQKIAIYFAEKLEMDEIGTNGQEVYLQACRNC